MNNQYRYRFKKTYRWFSNI